MMRPAKLLEFVNRVKRPRDVPEDTIELVEADTKSEAECRSVHHYTDEASSSSHYPSLTSEQTDFRLSLTLVIFAVMSVDNHRFTCIS